MNTEYPKILLIGQTFHNQSGGGITLTNLFSDWPEDRLAVAVNHYGIVKSNNEICRNYYQLGRDEHVAVWPFKFLRDKNPSGNIIINEYRIKPQGKRAEVKKVSGVKTRLIELFLRFLNFAGLSHQLTRYRISPGFINWITDFNPDIIYTQLASLELIRFIEDIMRVTNIGLAIHMMDDWPSTIAKDSLFECYWKKKIDGEFRRLLNRACVLISISEFMSIEYEKRYNRVFQPFHNPVDIKRWLPYIKTDYNINDGTLKILYSGRIGIGTFSALMEVAEAIEHMYRTGENVRLIIQSPGISDNQIKQFREKLSVIINEPVDYSKLPEVFSNADVLVVPIDFSAKGLTFLKFSMPTKVSEFMISGTPVLLYCSPGAGLYHHAKKYKWAHIISVRKRDKIIEGIRVLWHDLALRKQYGTNAFRFARDNWDADKIRSDFRKTIADKVYSQ